MRTCRIWSKWQEMWKSEMTTHEITWRDKPCGCCTTRSWEERWRDGEACFIAIFQLQDLANSCDACCCKPILTPLRARYSSRQSNTVMNKSHYTLEKEEKFQSIFSSKHRNSETAWESRDVVMSLCWHVRWGIWHVLEQWESWEKTQGWECQ